MSEHDFVATIEHGENIKTPSPKPPEDIAGQLEWLKVMTEEEKRLQSIEREFKIQFKATGNSATNSALLKDFTPSLNELEKTNIIEDIPIPRALVDLAEFTKEEIQQLNQYIQRMFPGIKSQEVTTTTGERLIAFIGTDTPTLVAAVRLVREEEAVEEAIKLESEKLGKTASSTGKAKAQQGIGPLPTPAKSTSRGPDKKGFQVV